jgi:diguanylate cyclase (GGDEF)-like protein/PAS domain S-box-containing protein
LPDAAAHVLLIPVSSSAEGAEVEIPAYFYEKALDILYEGVYVLDRERTIVSWNKAAEDLTGFTAEEVVGKSCFGSALEHMDDEGKSLCERGCPVARALTDGREREERMYLHHKDGHRVPVLVRVIPVLDESRVARGAIEAFTDVSGGSAALSRLHELREMALLDPLTGLGNRRYTGQKLGERLEEMRRYGWPFGVLFVDIDRFKNVNDEFGHDAGDRVLKMVATTLLKSLRPFDVLGRWGGEEFLALLVNVDVPQLQSVAERSRILVANSSVPVEDDDIRVTVSIGATLARPQDSPRQLVRRADRLLYQSKRAGRNLVTVE